jgi:hypothetical protein
MKVEKPNEGLIKWLGNAKPYEVGTNGRRVVFDGREMEPEAAIFLATEILIAARSAMFRIRSQLPQDKRLEAKKSFPSTDLGSTPPLPHESASSP